MTTDSPTTRARLETVEEHIRRENLRDLDGIMATFGDDARYDDQPWDEHHHGREAVRSYYERLVTAMPDLHVEVLSRHVGKEAIVLEVLITGTHRGPWRGLPATGRELRFPLCAVYTFTEEHELAGERIYYDRAMVLRQLGFFRDPESLLGRVGLVLGHPISAIRGVLRS